MSSNFPTSLDSYAGHNPGDVILDTHVDNVEDAIEAIEATVGITGSAVTTSHDYRIALLETSAVGRFSLWDFYPGGAYAPNGTAISHTPGDGNTHALSNYYGSLAAAQADYPNVGALTATADTAAMQLWAQTVVNYNGIGGTGVIPTPAVNYLLNETTSFAPTGSRTTCRIDGPGPWNAITWTGPNDDIVFDVRGAWGCHFDGIAVRTYGSAGSPDGIVVWEVDDDATRVGTDLNVWDRCHVNFTPTTVNSYGWRIGHVGTRDESVNSWRNCLVNSGIGDTGDVAGSIADALANNCYGWSSENYNVLANTWDTCSVVGLAGFWTATTPDGSTAGQGGDSATFINCGASFTYDVITAVTPGHYVMLGGRYENGARLVNIPNSQWYGPVIVRIDGATLGGYLPPSGVLINMEGSTSLVFDNVHYSGTSASNATAALITLNTYGAGTFRSRGCAIQMAAAGPYWTNTAGYRVDVDSTWIDSTNFVVQGRILARNAGATASVADGGTITHGLAATPTWARVTPSVAGEMVSVTTLGATTITCAIKKHDNSAGTTQTLYWEAGI